jgi:hypothetical protein
MMQKSDQDFAAQFSLPEALDGTHGVVWLAQDERRTTTQAATNVRYTLRVTPQQEPTRDHTASLPPAWEGTLDVAREDSYLQPHTDIILTLDDGRQVSGYIRSVHGHGTQHADVIINGWVEAWI